jgi:hypothetical protein
MQRWLQADDQEVDDKGAVNPEAVHQAAIDREGGTTGAETLFIASLLEGSVDFTVQL